MGGAFTAKTGWEATRSVNVWCSVASLATVLPHLWRHRANLPGLVLVQVAPLGTAGMCQPVIHLRMVLLPRHLRQWVLVRWTRHIRARTPVVSSHWKSLRYTTRKIRAGLFDGKVYDFTAFLDEHPAGAEAILKYGGQDGSDIFHAIHTAEMLEDFKPLATLAQG